jgi:hypothetical protein
MCWSTGFYKRAARRAIPLSSADINLLTPASMQTPRYVRQQMAGPSLAYAPVLSAIRVSVLVVQGQVDRVANPAVGELTHQMIPGSRLFP